MSVNEEMITLAELVDRCEQAAAKDTTERDVKILLSNVSRALIELAVRLDEAMRPTAKSKLIVMPSSEN